ncbi:terminase small subunit [Azorhizobium caulinodans]|uniref:terminase small subunit n=1 Tax=Azorhizobium caulinodans TaxID=7 RepID=UPI002FBE8547
MTENKRNKNGLTDKQARFVEEYMIDLNATQAAIRSGYSAKTAADIGRQLLRKTPVALAIAERQRALSEQTGVTAERIIEELAKIAFYDIRKAVRWGRAPDGEEAYPVELVPSEQIDDATAAAVAEVSLTQSGVKIKMHDKRAALVDLGKHLGMFKERVEHSGEIQIVIGTDDAAL